MSIEIRKAQLEDATALSQLLKSLGWFAHLSSEPIEITCDRLSHHLQLCHGTQSHSIYVAEQNGEIVGYVAVHWLPYLILAGPEGFISELFVQESARGQGIGTQLLETVKAEAQARSCSRLLLENNRDRDSYKRRFYESRGWRERQKMASFVYDLQ